MHTPYYMLALLYADFLLVWLYALKGQKLLAQGNTLGI